MTSEHPEITSHKYDVTNVSIDGANGGNIFYSRYGKIVTISIANVTITTNTWFTIGTLPTGYRPTSIFQSVGAYGAYGSQYPVGIRVQTNGQVQAGVVASGASVSGVWGFMTFITAD